MATEGLKRKISAILLSADVKDCGQLMMEEEVGVLQRIVSYRDLIDASIGSHLWTKAHDRELKDIFSLRNEIAQ